MKALYQLVRELDDQDYVYTLKEFTVSSEGLLAMRRFIDYKYNIEFWIGEFFNFE